MAEFFTILLFVNIAAWVYFLIKPLSLVIKGNTFPRWKIFLGGIFSMMILLAAIAATAPPVDKKTDLENQSSNALVKDENKSLAPSEDKKNVVEKDLGLTLDEFKKTFNAQAKDKGIKLQIKKIKIDKSGDVHTFNIELSKYQGIIGTINPEDKILSINSISAGDGTLQSGANMLYLAICLVNTFNPSGTKQENAQFALGLFRQAADGKDGETYKAEIGNFEFSSIISKSLGFWFSVYPKD